MFPNGRTEPKLSVRIVGASLDEVSLGLRGGVRTNGMSYGCGVGQKIVRSATTKLNTKSHYAGCGRRVCVSVCACVRVSVTVASCGLLTYLGRSAVLRGWNGGG